MTERLMRDISLELSDLLVGENLGFPDVRCTLNNHTDNFEARVYTATPGYSGHDVVLFAGEGATAEAALEDLIISVKMAQAARTVSAFTDSSGLVGNDPDIGGEG